MNRIAAILMTVAVVGALLAVPLGVSAAATEHSETTTGENSSIAPGERLAGTVGVQQATVDGDLSNRTYDVRLRNADSDEERADIVAERSKEIEQRLTDHRAELAELRAARDAGNISDGTYRARVATVAAKKSSTEQSAKQAETTARQLPDSVLDDRDISVVALDELRTNASELGGEETAEIAREIGGPNVSNPTGDNLAADRPGTNQADTAPTAGLPGANREGNESLDDERPTEAGQSTDDSGNDSVVAHTQDTSATEQGNESNGPTEQTAGATEPTDQQTARSGNNAENPADGTSQRPTK